MSMEAPASVTAAPPSGDFDAVAAPAPASAAPPQAAPAQSFKVGSIVKTGDGKTAVVIAVEAAPREQVVVDENGQPQGKRLVNLEGYRLAYFAGSIDSPHTAQELGLQAP
jgi:hypothetical protein